MPSKNTQADKLVAFLNAHAGVGDRLPADQYKAIKAEVGQFRDAELGGLTKEAYDKFKGNKEIVAAAKADRAAKGKTADKPAKAEKKTEGKGIEAKVTKFLNAHAGIGERLPKEEYAALKADVGQFRDAKKGGLTKEAYDKFKGNDKVVEAAKADRVKMTEKAKEKMPKAKTQTR